ncbi:hypothetical protein BN1708_003185 [Verticillium longisporum]|uniref:NAD-specific glutamate dehydrogenase n=1 Tax=Verticillium longisporum TaxID=100787 RepID=A0A0G4LB06_VERLO|nr:hypothetical protein BN1708_003185 [Verticillium longisporum]
MVFINFIQSALASHQNVTILDDVILALGHDLALGLDLGLVSELLQHGEVVDEGLDERLLKVGVNDTGGARGLGAVAQGPLPDLVRAGREEAAEVERLAHLDDELGKGRVSANLLLLLEGLLLGLEAAEALLVGNGDGDDGVASGVLLDPLGDLGEMLVLLADVVTLGEVNEVDDRLGRQEEERVDDLDLRELLPVDDLLDGVLLGNHLLHLETLAARASLLLLGLEGLLDELDIFQSELLADDVQITRGVDVTLDVNNLSIVEGAHHLEDGIDGTNVGQEGVAETSTGRGTAGQTGNVIDGQVGGDTRLGVVLLAQPVVARIGDDDAGLLGVDGGVGEVLHLGQSMSREVHGATGTAERTYSRVAEVALGDGLKEGGFADVGKADL